MSQKVPSEARVLVTGGAGYVGSVVVEALIEAGMEVVVLDNLSTGHRDALPPKVGLFVGDISNSKFVTEICVDHEIDTVIHLAALSVVADSMRDPAKYYRVNVAGGLALLKGMLDAAVKRIVFSSSAAVYGDPPPSVGSIIEEIQPAPASPYGETKLMFENILATYGSAYGVRHTSLRYFNAAGASKVNGEAHDLETHLIPSILEVALGIRPALEIFGTDFPTIDGTAKRDFVHVEDIARAHVLAVQALDRPELSRVFNIGSGSGYTVKDVIETARLVTNRPIEVVARARRDGDPPRLIANYGRIYRELRWMPKKILRNMIIDAWAWRLVHPNGYVR